MIPELDDWTAMVAAHPVPREDPAPWWEGDLVLDPDSTALLRALCRETRGATLAIALNRAREAVAAVVSLPSPMAVAGYLDEITALKDRVRLLEHVVTESVARQRETERRAIEAERRSP